eukprot:1539534-Pyramimonas_sp.AAC.1
MVQVSFKRGSTVNQMWLECGSGAALAAHSAVMYKCSSRVVQAWFKYGPGVVQVCSMREPCSSSVAHVKFIVSPSLFRAQRNCSPSVAQVSSR